MKPPLLFISPVTPHTTGNGLAMRAGMVLRGLATHYSVHLLVVSLYPSGPLPAALARLCRQVCTVPLPEFSRQSRWPPWRLPQWFAWRRFHTVHVFRMALLPWLSGLLEGRTCHLDFDDLEPQTHLRLSEIHQRNGDALLAEEEAERAAECAEAESAALARFQRLYVCSNADRAHLEPRAPGRVRVLPNAVDLPSQPPAAPAGGPCRLLFIGTLGYLPNQDAVRYLSREILPELRRVGLQPAVEVAGPGAPETLLAEMRAAGIECAGAVPDLAPCYQRATAVVVPLRAGGGTRIKILEAFAQGRPVVSTSVGCEGLEVRDGTHLLVRDTPAGFAEACLRLARDASLREHLTGHADALVRGSYSPASVAAALAP